MVSDQRFTTIRSSTDTLEKEAESARLAHSTTVAAPAAGIVESRPIPTSIRSLNSEWAARAPRLAVGPRPAPTFAGEITPTIAFRDAAGTIASDVRGIGIGARFMTTQIESLQEAVVRLAAVVADITTEEAPSV